MKLSDDLNFFYLYKNSHNVIYNLLTTKQYI